MATTAKLRERYFRRQAMRWLALAGAMLIAWLILWVASAAPTIISNESQQTEVEELTLPTRIERLGELDKEVQPIAFETLVRDLRTYPAEFKDKKYFANKSGYTLQLMDVSQNDLIVNYLDTIDTKGDFRKNFAYFRYLDDNQKPRYVLTYGNFDSVDSAKATAAKTVLNLPQSVVPTVVKISSYLDIIDDYERGEGVWDYADSQPRQVKLQTTRSEIPVQPATKKDDELAKQSQAQEESQVQMAQDVPDEQVVSFDEPDVATEPKPAQMAKETKEPKNSQDKPKADKEKPRAEEPARATSAPSQKETQANNE